jgi:hypothetical protein
MTDAQFIAWLKDSAAIRCVLVEVNVKSGGVETTRFLSNKGYVTSPTDTPANTRYSPFIAGGVKFTETLSLDGAANLSFGDIEIDNLSGDRDSWLDDVWTNRAIKVFIGDVRWNRTQFRQIFDGIVAGMDTKNRGRINLKISDKLQRLNGPITETKLGGTTANADRLLPLCFGECHNVEPLLINPSVNEYQVHDGAIEQIIEVRDNGVPVAFTPFLSTGKFRLAKQPSGQITASVQGAILPEALHTDLVVGGTFDNAADINFWTAQHGTTSHVAGTLRVTSLGTGVTARAWRAFPTVPGRKYRVTVQCIGGTATASAYINYTGISTISGGTALGGSAGTINLSSVITATGTSTALILYGNSVLDATASFDNVSFSEVVFDAGYSNGIAPIVRRIATAYGAEGQRLTAGEIDRESMTAFHTANPQPVGLYLKDRMNVIEALTKLVSSIGGRVLMDRAGRLAMLRLTLPQATPGTTVTPTDIVTQSLHVSQLPKVEAGVQIGYCKNWTKQDSNIAAGVPIDHADLYKQEWLTVTRTDTLTAADHLTFTEPTMKETLLLANADAVAEALRRLNMFNVQRRVYKYTGMPWLMLEGLGSSQTLKNQRFGLEDGKTGQIISLATDWLNPHITVEILI